MTYNDALMYIGSRLRFGIKPGLDRMRRLLCRLGDPQKGLHIIHVAGTNGKGSVCTMTAAGLIAAGFKTGLYTSPYICDFRERIQIDSQMIPEQALADLTAEVAAIIEDDDETTEFEVITCIALLWYARQGCERVVLETGLGGRLDATNIIDPPALAAITRIDLDHTAILGDTLAAIAGEKAGIIKRGSCVVISPGQPEEALETLVARCRELDIEPIIPDLDAVDVLERSLDGTRIRIGSLELNIPLLGEHQITNALTAVELLREDGISDAHIAEGIARAFIPARMELLHREPPVILDGAHNPNGAAALCSAIETLLCGRRVVAVMGALRDKDYSRELSMLAPLFERIYFVDGFSERCETAERLCAAGGSYTQCFAAKTPERGVELALEFAEREGAAVVICGSLYLAGRVRGFIMEKCRR